MQKDRVCVLERGWVHLLRAEYPRELNSQSSLWMLSEPGFRILWVGFLNLESLQCSPWGKPQAPLSLRGSTAKMQRGNNLERKTGDPGWPPGQPLTSQWNKLGHHLQLQGHLTVTGSWSHAHQQTEQPQQPCSELECVAPYKPTRYGHPIRGAPVYLGKNGSVTKTLQGIYFKPVLQAHLRKEANDADWSHTSLTLHPNWQSICRAFVDLDPRTQEGRHCTIIQKPKYNEFPNEDVAP